MIEFHLDGRIISANKLFCDTMGYRREDIVDRHHKIFVSDAVSSGSEYGEFWAKLGRGEFVSGEFLRQGKGGRDVWLRASYTPILNRAGRPAKVVKLALDVTAEKERAVEDAGKMEALQKVQAVIEFLPSGEILTANANFLNAVGYGADEIAGKHHSIFVDPAVVASADYADFWNRLRSGEPMTGEFKRFGKERREVFLQASYNPIFDLNRQVVKVVKFATDVTERVRAVSTVGHALSQLAKGDLAQRLDRSFSPDLDQLRVDLNSAVENLDRTMSQIVLGSRNIRAGTDEVAQSSDDLSKRTEQQAASLEETAAALDEITSTIRKTSEGSGEARAMVAAAKADAETSGAVVRDAVSAMAEIDRSSGEISNIIGVIDEIAFQTNLLALNAGVEAARAGDAGKGFAVVASEVRALAQRSADAAKEIKSLIQASADQVKRGVSLVGETGRALERIVAQVGSINDIIVEISASTQEQAIGLAEVNTAVNQMDQVTQQNAAMVEESTAAARLLANETEPLAGLVAQFQTRTASEAAAPQAARRAKAVPALKVVGGRGRSTAAARPAAATATVAEEGWEEF